MAISRRNKGRRSHRHLEPHIGGWQIVYTGFILILLCFFILLTSFASLEQSKVTQFAQAFSNAVSVFSGGSSLEKGETMINTDAMIMEKENKMARLFDKVQMLSRQADLTQVKIHKSERGVIMTLANKLLFSSGDAQLSVRSIPLLQKIGRIINKIDVPIEIGGHTDDVPIRTRAYPSNWELSTARAVNVLRYLIERQGIDTRRLSAVGFSSYQPSFPNDSLENRAGNRRVEIIFNTD